MALRAARTLDATYVVMDEFHYYSDHERGVAWQVPLLVLPQTQFLLMSATLGDTRAIAERLETSPGAPVASRHARTTGRCRSTSSTRETPLHETIEELVEQGKSPIYVVNFTQRDVRRAGAGADERRRSATKEEARDRRASRGGALRHPLRQGAAALPPLRHRRPPRGAPAQVPAARRAARAEGAARGHLRHRHARRRRQHPDPHRALHQAREVRRREDGHPLGARLQADRRAGRAEGFDDAGSVVARRPEHIVEKKQARRSPTLGEEGGEDGPRAAEGAGRLEQGDVREA